MSSFNIIFCSSYLSNKLITWTLIVGSALGLTISLQNKSKRVNSYIYIRNIILKNLRISIRKSVSFVRRRSKAKRKVRKVTFLKNFSSNRELLFIRIVGVKFSSMASVSWWNQVSVNRLVSELSGRWTGCRWTVRKPWFPSLFH